MRGPVGRYAWSAPLLAWACTPRLVGLAHIGAIDQAHLPLLEMAAALPFHPDLRPPYTAIIDSSRLTYIAPGLFPFLVQHLLALRERGGTLLARVAMIRPPGLNGAAAFGLASEHMGAVVPVGFVDTLAEAVDYAGITTDRDLVLGELEEAYALPTLIGRVRSELRSNPVLSMVALTQCLGISTRTLQRSLASADTSFRLEAAKARLEFAVGLIRSTDEKLETVAARCGFSSPASLARSIREGFGKTPSELRREAQGRCRN
jgi:AraC-like DNA-binding protein